MLKVLVPKGFQSSSIPVQCLTKKTTKGNCKTDVKSSNDERFNSFNW